MTGPDSDPILEDGGGVGGGEGRVGDEDPVVGEAIRAAIGAVPDREGVDVGGSAEIELPPWKGLDAGMADGAAGEVAVGVAVDGQ